MRRLLLAALAVTAFVTLPAIASAQDVKAQRAERRAEMRQQRAERRAEVLQRMMERRPQLKARVEQRRAQGKRVDPLARKLMMERRLKRRQPDLFNRLDLNQDGRLSPEELRQHRRRGRA
jgi:hypothetical protein